MKTKTIYVTKDTTYYIKKSLQDFISDLSNALGQIPIEYRDSVIIHIEGCQGYGDDINLDYEISYQRPPTKEEQEEEEIRRKNLKKLEITHLQARLKQLQQED